MLKFVAFSKNIILTNNLELKISNCMKKFYFTIKLLKRGFVANAKWRKEPGFGMLHHICFSRK